jgi:hypothetical protein
MRIELTEKQFKLAASRKQAFDIARQGVMVAQKFLENEANAFSQAISCFAPEDDFKVGPLDQVKIGKDDSGFFLTTMDPPKPLALADRTRPPKEQTGTD